MHIKTFSIKTQLLTIVCFSAFVMLFLFTYSYSVSSDIIKKKNSEYIHSMMDQMNQNIASNCDVLDRIVQNISYSLSIQNFLVHDTVSARVADYKEVKDLLVNMMSLKDGIIDIALFGKNGTAINVYGDISMLQGITNEFDDKTIPYYSSLHQLYYNQIKRNCFIVGCRINSARDDETFNQDIGTLLIVIKNTCLISEDSRNMKLGATYVYLTDRNDHVFFSNDREFPEGCLFSESRIHKTAAGRSVPHFTADDIYSTGIPKTGGRISFFIPESELLKGLDIYQSRMIVLLVLALIILLFVLAGISRNILRPIRIFIQNMNEIKSGNLEKRISLQGYTEIQTMSRAFNQMLEKISTLTENLYQTKIKLYETELVKKQSEMNYLRSQINPHFLYNTFESIMGIAADEGNMKIFDMIRALGQIFRYSISGSDVVPLGREIEMVKNYLLLQKVRFGPRIHDEWAVDNDCVTVNVPKMFLQPIVENAIYHGIEPKTGESLLEFAVKRNSGSIVIRIKENGVGMDPDTLARVRKSLRVHSSAHSEIGLVNVYQRLEFMYGKNFDFSIDSILNSGTEVCITLHSVQEEHVQHTDC
ncbi:MAG: sensor histidine kinase [Treponema sp.]